MASRVALARCALVVARVSPMISPRADGSQSGAPRPVSAGTNTTPPESGTPAASCSVSPAEATRPSPSRSHCTAAPVTKIAPSRAYSSRPPGCPHATVVSSPADERTGWSPVFTRMNDPVP